MTTEVERQHVLQTCETLVQKEEYDQALEMLKPMDCVLASWMKGKIYLVAAERLANSFAFKFYCTDEQKKQYREILALAYEHLYRTGCLMPAASSEIRELLNPNLWHEIGKVENELARTRPVVVVDDRVDDSSSNDCDYDDDDFHLNEKHHVESMVDQIEFWTL